MASKKGDAKGQAKADRGVDDDRVPTYEEATGQVASSSGQAATSGPAAPLVGPTAVPFPSLGTTQDGYGESPYQSDGTLRIVIAQPGQLMSYQAQQPQHGYVLPPPASAADQRRGPPAGRRFLAAFFWAVMLYTLLSLAVTALVEYNDPDMARPHPPNDGQGPPGWHHHHGKEGNHKLSLQNIGMWPRPAVGTALLPRIDHIVRGKQ